MFKNLTFSKYFALISYLDSKTKQNCILIIIFSLVSASLDSLTLLELSSLLNQLTTSSSSNSPIHHVIRNYFLINDNKGTFIVLFLIYALLIVSLISRVSIIYFIKTVTAQVGYEIKKNIYRQILRKSCVWHESNHSSSFISNLTKDSDNYLKAFGAILSAITNFILAIVVITTLLSINYVITILFGCIIVIGYTFIVLINKRKTKYLGKVVSLSHENFLRNASSSFANIRFINLRGNFIEFEDIVGINLKKEEYSKNYLAFRGEFPKIVIESLLFLSILSVASYSLVSSNYDTLEFGVVGLIGIAKVIGPAQAVYIGFNSLQANYEAAIRVLPYFTGSKNHSIISHAAIENFDELTLNGLNVVYKDKNTILNNINFSIKKGEKVGIIGKTGSGKSTLTNCMLGLQKPTSGTVLVNGKDINNDKIFMRKWLNSVSEVPQSIQVIDGSILQNIIFSYQIDSINWSQVQYAISIANLKEFIDSLPDGLNHKLTESASNLSGGQLQRLAIARAIYFEPKFLVLDEVTSALDNKTEDILLENFATMRDTSFIFIAHRLKCLDICDHVYEIKNKQLVQLK